MRDAERRFEKLSEYESGQLAPPAPSFYKRLDDLPLESKCRSSRWAEVLSFAEAPATIVQALELRPLVLFRPLATPNFELLRFLDLASELGRPAIVFEYPADTFAPTANPTKRALARLPIVIGTDHSGSPRFQKVRVLDLKGAEGRPLSALHCQSGERLLTFHHRALELLAQAARVTVLDASEFTSGSGARESYERLFALFTCSGVLAESICLEGWERPFTEAVILPAYEATLRRFGAPPCIAQLLPPGAECDPYWEAYPPTMLALAAGAAKAPHAWGARL